MGVGPRGPEGIVPAALAAVSQAGAVFADDYTALLPQDVLDHFERARGAAIPRLGRERIEKGTEILAAAARPGGAVLLVAGDPMAATTHVSLRVEALRRGIPVKLLFAPSITHTAFSEAGLQHYKAGRVVSLPYPDKSFAPTSPAERILENKAAGLHTLVLLDIQSEPRRCMTANEAIYILLGLAKRAGLKGLDPHTLVVAVARAGEPTALVRAGAAERVAELDLGPPMHCLIVPGRLHFEERDALEVVGLARKEELPPPS